MVGLYQVIRRFSRIWLLQWCDSRYWGSRNWVPRCNRHCTSWSLKLAPVISSLPLHTYHSFHQHRTSFPSLWIWAFPVTCFMVIFWEFWAQSLIELPAYASSPWDTPSWDSPSHNPFTVLWETQATRQGHIKAKWHPLLNSPSWEPSRQPAFAASHMRVQSWMF